MGGHLAASQHRPFPPAMTPPLRWGQVKTFHLCGAAADDDEERLCLVEIHTRATAAADRSAPGPGR